MRYKTKKNLARAIERVMEKGYDRHTASYLANHLFQITKRHNQSVEELIRVLEPKEIKK